MTGLSTVEKERLRALNVGRFHGRSVWLRWPRRLFVSARRSRSRSRQARLLVALAGGIAIVGVITAAVTHSAWTGQWTFALSVVAIVALLAVLRFAHQRTGVEMWSPEGARLRALPCPGGIELSDLSRWSYVDQKMDRVLAVDAENLAVSALAVLRNRDVYAATSAAKLVRKYRDYGFVAGRTVHNLSRGSRWSWHLYRYMPGRGQTILCRPAVTGP